jgi:hypothetical protein
MKRFTTMFGIVALLLVSLSHAQQKWERTYGGTNRDRGNSVQQTTDGGYIVAGGTGSFGIGYQVYLIKTDASGDTLWTRNYGGTDYDDGRSVRQTSDGGFIIAGATASFGAGSYDVYLIKTNASGVARWTKFYGGSLEDWGNSVQQTSDGGYIVVGSKEIIVGRDKDVYLLKTDAFGDTLWTRTYGGTSEDYGYSVQQTSDGGYIVAGHTFSFVPPPGYPDVWLIKTNASGDTLWTRTYGGTNFEYGYSVQQTSDGGYIIAGYTESFGAGYGDIYLIKTNASGDTLWTKNYGGINDDYGNSVQQTSDGGYIIAGGSCTFGQWGCDVYLIKTNASGNRIWARTYSGTDWEVGNSVRQALDGGYIIAGYTHSFGAGDDDFYLIKTDSLGRSSGVEETAEVRGQRLEVRITAKPNPFTSFATLPGHEAERFSLYDISGRKVGTYQGGRVGEGLAPGVYFLRSSDGQDKPLRIVKVR